MAAVELLDMEPVVRPPRLTRGKLVVLQVVPSHQDLHAVRALKAQRRHRLCGAPLLRIYPALGPEPAGALQLGSDLVQFPGASGPGELIQHAVEVFQLLFALRDQLCEVLLRALELAVFLKAGVQVLLRRLYGIQRDRHQGQVLFVVVFTLQNPVAAMHTVEIGLEQLRLAADVFEFFGPAQLLALCGELALLPVAGPPHGLDQFLGPPPLQLLPLHRAVTAVQQLADAAVFGFLFGHVGLCRFRFRGCVRLLLSKALRHRRQFVPQAGEQGARPVFRERDAAQAVENAPVRPDEDHVRRSAHQLGDQAELRAVAEFVPALQTEDDQAVAVRLFDAAHARAGQVFAQQHAEHGRFFGVFKALLREMHTGVGPGGTDQKLPVLPFRAHRQKDQVLLRLLDFFDSAVCEAFGEFLRQRRDGHTVQCHPLQTSVTASNSSRIRSCLPVRYSQPSRASSPVALWYSPGFAWAGTPCTWLFLPRL